MKIEWNKATWYSWTLTGIIFLILIPLLVFYFITQFKNVASLQAQIPETGYIKINTDTIVESEVESEFDSLSCATSSLEKSIVADGVYGNYIGATTVGGTLTIGTSTSNGFGFSFDVINSRLNIGNLGGNACKTLKLNVFLYKDDGAYGDICKVIFKYDDIKKKMTILTHTCSAYAGYGVFFDGDYIKNKKPDTFTASYITLFKNTSQKDKFTSLVGNYIENFNFITDEDVTEHTLNTGVRIREVVNPSFDWRSLIAIDDNENIWALSLDYDPKKEETFVRYFTNVAKDANYVPDWLKSAREDVDFCDNLNDIKAIKVSYESDKGKPIKIDTTEELCGIYSM